MGNEEESGASWSSLLPSQECSCVIYTQDIGIDSLTSQERHVKIVSSKLRRDIFEVTVKHTYEHFEEYKKCSSCIMLKLPDPKAPDPMGPYIPSAQVPNEKM